MLFRLRKAEYNNVLPVGDNPDMTVEYVLHRIKTLLTATTASGVDIMYMGSGRKETGEWCFKDGYIKFEDIMNLHNSYFRGEKLVIYSDCSYSGTWVQLAMKYMESHQISPCLHSARDKETVISVYSSCHSHQIPFSLLTPVRAWINDKNTGYCIFSIILRVAQDHSTWGCHNSEIICKAASLESDCLLSKSYTWQRRMDERRLVLTNCSGGVWKLFLVIEDPEIYYQVLSGQAKVDEYGELLKSGLPDDVIQWLNKEYVGHSFEFSQFRNS